MVNAKPRNSCRRLARLTG